MDKAPPAAALPTSSQSHQEALRKEPSVCSALRNIRSPRKELETGQGKQVDTLNTQ